MESQPQSPEFRNNPENLHSRRTELLCILAYAGKVSLVDIWTFQLSILNTWPEARLAMMLGRLENIKLFSCSTQLSLISQLLIKLNY